jgi:hypothetical protein
MSTIHSARLLQAAVCLAALLFATGCGTRHAAPATGPRPEMSAAQLPAFPTGREIRVATPHVLEANVTFARSTNTQVSGTNLSLPGDGTVAWAEYRFATGAAALATLTVDKQGAGGQYYLGIADYGRQRWQIQGPFIAASKDFALDAGNYTSPGSNLYCFVATFSGGAALLDKLTLTMDSPAYAPDTLYAEPLQPDAAINTPVTVLVTTGMLPNPFEYMVGVGLTTDSDASYVAKSFNYGAVGGDVLDGAWTGPADGIWAQVNPANFLTAPDSSITSTDLGGGRVRWDLNVTPLSGTEVVHASGALFNIQFQFATAGTKVFGFQAVSGVKRTYYADSTTEYNWGSSANDGTGGHRNAVTISPAATYQPDTLYAEPLQAAAAVGDPVTVQVTTGTLSNPFKYMAGVGLTIETDAVFVRKSFQYGAVGGDFIDYDNGNTWTGPADGIWAAVNPSGFLVAPDSFISSVNIGAGRERWDFNITPQGGAVVTSAAGELFNAQFSFAAPGTKTFGFQAIAGVKRTYYSDESFEYTWNDISNAGSGGIANSVVITAGNPAYAADSLYAEPQQAVVNVGDPVMVLVTTGALSNPFQYMAGVGLTIETDADFVRKSFQFGALGGDFVDYDNGNTWTGPADGIWSAVNPGTFLVAPDSSIVSSDIGGGRERWDFSITPLGGADTQHAGGALFNAQFTFTAPGQKTFGFQAVSGVKRTYYSDSGSEYDWASIANDGMDGHPNSVIVAAPSAYQPDTLYAEPLQATAAVGAPVTVLVSTGKLPNPFYYMTGCGLTIEADADFVRKSFQYGEVGGDFIDYDNGNTWTGPADGVWALVNPANFFNAPDNFITSFDIGGGRERWDLAVIPLGGAEVTDASGALFNLQFKFSTPGVKTFGFQAFSSVKRTYYSDMSTEYNWADIANDGSDGVPNSVTIQ